MFNVTDGFVNTPFCERFPQFSQYNHSGITDISFSYTPSNQLASRAVSNDTHQIAIPTLSTESYSVNNLNQYTKVTAGGINKSLTYSTAGNMTSYDGWSYQYTNQNRLKKATKSGTTVNLTYDALGHLSSTTHNGSKIEYLYDGDELVAEYNGSGTLLRRYIHGSGIDDPVIRYDGGGTSSRRYLHRDERGTIIAETTASGSILARHQYGPFGQPINGSNARFRYTGQTLIPGTELYYYKARIYHPKLGRFLQTDPVGYEDQMNLYAYVHNDPVNLIDPDGRESRQAIQQEANIKDFKNGKITREEAQQNSYEMAGGDVTKAVVENLTPMRLYMDVAESLSQGDVLISEAAGVAGEAGSGAITGEIQKDLGSGGSLRAKAVKFVVETVAGELVQQGTEKIDELANKEIDQKPWSRTIQY